MVRSKPLSQRETFTKKVRIKLIAHSYSSDLTEISIMCNMGRDMLIEQDGYTIEDFGIAMFRRSLNKMIEKGMMTADGADKLFNMFQSKDVEMKRLVSIMMKELKKQYAELINK